MDAGVGHQVGLELRHIHVQGSVKAQGRREGRNNLRNQAVEVRVRGTLNIQVATANVVQGLVVEAKGTVRVLEQRVRAQDRVVRFHDRGRHLRRRRDGKRQLGLATIVDAQAFEQQATETRTGSSLLD